MKRTFPLFLGAILLSSATAFADFGDLKATRLPPNFKNVDAGIFRGGNPIDHDLGIEGIEALGSVGVKTIIDLQGGDDTKSLVGDIDKLAEPGETPAMIASERNMAETASMTFVNLPLDSHAEVTPAEDAEIGQALEILKSASAENPVFVHCEHGEDRTGLVIALYRVLLQGWTPADAHEEWVASGHNKLHQLTSGGLDKYFYSKTAGSH